MFYFFRNIFSKLTSSICFTIQAKLLCSWILRFKCVEIFEAIGILSDLKDSVHNIRRLANQVFINLNQKKLNAFLVKRFFICILFRIQICRFTVQGKAVFMYVGFLQNIHINRQWVNCDLIKEEILSFFGQQSCIFELTLMH